MLPIHMESAGDTKEQMWRYLSSYRGNVNHHATTIDGQSDFDYTVIIIAK